MNRVVMADDGYILILILLLLTVLMSTGMFLADHFLIRQKVVHNLYMEQKTYYLAEGGIEYAASRLSIDPLWRTTGFTLNLQKEGLIYITVLNEAEEIHVRAKGSVGQFSRSKDAFFTKLPPISRIR